VKEGDEPAVTNVGAVKEKEKLFDRPAQRRVIKEVDFARLASARKAKSE